MDIQDIQLQKKGVAKYYQLQEDIYRRIRNGELKIGDSLPGERQLAQMYNVAHMTVRQAIAKLVEVGVLCRQHGSGTFVASDRKIPIRSKNNPSNPKAISVLLPASYTKDSKIQAPYIKHGILEAVYQVMSQPDFQVNIAYFPPDETSTISPLEKCLNNNVAGVIFWYIDTPKNNLLLDEMKERKIPFVLVNNYSINPYDYVVVDSRKGAAEMMKHLASLGHSKIAYLNSDESATSVKERKQGFLDGVKKYQLKGSKEFMVPIRQIKKGSLQDILKQLVEDGFSAIFAYNDFLAIKSVRELQGMGVKVPEQISLVGFDDIDISQYVLPALTTVRQDFYKIGLQAAKILLKKISCKGKKSPVLSAIKLTPNLVIRESSRSYNE